MKNSNVTYKDVIRFAAHYWRRHARFGAGAAALMFTATAIDALVPVYVGKIVDALAQGAPGNLDSYGRAMQFFFVFLIISLVFHLLRAGSMYLWNIFAIRNLYEIVSESMQKVQRFSADWHANSFAGATVRKITRGMWSFDVFEDTLFMGLMPAVVITVAMCAMLILKLPEVGLFASFMVLLYAIFSILMSIRVLAPLFRESARADTKMGATLADIMTGIPTIKAFGAEEREDGLFREVSTLWRRRAIKSWQTAQTVDLSRGLLRVVMMTGMILLTIWMWKQGRSSPGDIALALTSFFIIGGYLRDVGMHITNLQKSVSEMEDAISFWLQDTEVRDASGAPAIRISQGGITFDNVTFAYKGQERPTFAGFNIDIRPGEKIALVGPSGSGKSTFVKLIQRLYDVQGGRILIDGQDIAAVTQESLRRHIALVPQDPILFHRSLAVNIAYGRPGAGLAEIEDAARKAYAHDFITALPQGYETLVGERGVKLSGGERQRVAIARAILANAPILILDEATSSLDSISEHYIQKALEALMEGRTTITVAHRLSTIQKADRILVFAGGLIVEQGTHAELVARPGSQYRNLYEMQAFDLVGNG